MSISERAVNKPVTSLIIFVIAVALGIYCTFNLSVDMYPNMEIPYMIVYTTYTNAGPEEVEQNLTRTLESSLSGLNGLKKMQSQSSTGMSLIILEMNYGTNMDVAANDIRDKIDLVRTYLPDEAETPITMRMDPSMMPIMEIAMQGSRSPEELRRYAEDVVKPRLEQIDGIASATVTGGKERSINIDIPRDRLEAYSLTITQVAQMIGAQNIQAAGGSITAGDKNYTIKTSGKYKSLDDIRNTVISYAATTSDGVNMPQLHTVLLRDVADVYDGYKDQTTISILDGKPTVMLMLQKQSGKNSVKAAHSVRNQMKTIEKSLPSDVKLVEVFNTTDIIESSIHEVVKSVIEGALLAILVLFLFLRSFKSTIIIGLSIPVSVFITLALMYFRGMTLNIISLSGLLLGSGMLVDNSIVVLENIYTYRERDTKPKVAAVLGTKEMVNAVVASTLTTVCIFLPMIMFNSKLGMMGQLFNDIAFTIVFSLLCSLLTAIILVPVLTSSVLKIENVTEKQTNSRWGKISHGIGLLFYKMERGYANTVRKLLHHKKVVVFTLAGLFILSIASVRFIGFIFMPESANDSVAIDFELPKGTKIDVTEATVQEMETIARQVVKGIKYSIVSAGGSTMLASSSDTNKGTLTLRLYPAKERKRGWDTDATAKEKLRKYFTKFPGTDVSFSSGFFSIGNSGLSIDIRSNDLDLVRNTSKNVVKLLKEQGSAFVSEPTSDIQEGLPQIEIVLDRARMYELGLNVATIGSEISNAINGKTASRYQDAGNDIDVIVKLSEEDRRKVSDLDQIYVKNVQGVRIPLSNFAHTVESSSPVTIFREDQSRIAHVTCKPLTGLSLDKVQSGLKHLIDVNIPMEEDLSITFAGDYADMMEAVKNFALIILMAIILVFAVMASQFESLKSPFIILFTIPLSIIGVVLIYLITRMRFNVVTVVGVLMLVGIIVNNGIVLVDQTNLLRKRGMSLEDACVEAAGNRLRPILMSTLTTIISLVPMAFFPGEGTEAMQPIGLTVFGGLTFGTIMTLFLMPIVYSLFNKKDEARKVSEQKSIEAANASGGNK
jgi:hydrophobic/amphiphilic exporter-1 (mainly G- bacteria), HAE1 family